VAVLYPTVTRIVDTIVAPLALAEDPTRTGGWFSFWRYDRRTDMVVPVVGFPVGYASADRFFIYQYLANEKPARLAQHPDHVSSWQSRENCDDSDKLKRRPGGAVQGGSLYFPSFSGYREPHDEMVSSLTGLDCGILTPSRLGSIVEASNNTELGHALMRLHPE